MIKDYLISNKTEFEKPKLKVIRKKAWSKFAPPESRKNWFSKLTLLKIFDNSLSYFIKTWCAIDGAGSLCF